MLSVNNLVVFINIWKNISHVLHMPYYVIHEKENISRDQKLGGDLSKRATTKKRLHDAGSLKPFIKLTFLYSFFWVLKNTTQKVRQRTHLNSTQSYRKINVCNKKINKIFNQYQLDNQTFLCSIFQYRSASTFLFSCVILVTFFGKSWGKNK